MSKLKISKSYVPLSKDVGHNRIHSALRSGTKITFWEKGSTFRYDLKTYEFSFQNQNSPLITLDFFVDEKDGVFPANWNFVGLLYHMIFEGISYLGKVLCEKQTKLSSNEKRLKFKIQFDLGVFAVERRNSRRVRFSNVDTFSLRVKLIDPPLILDNELEKSNVINLFSKDQVQSQEAVWKEFVNLIKITGKHTDQKNEIFMNYPIIDLSETGVSIPLTRGEKDYYEHKQSFSNSCALEFSRETIEIPKLKYVYSREIYHSGWSFDGDTWVKKQLEMKLKHYSNDVEDDFEKLVV